MIPSSHSSMLHGCNWCELWLFQSIPCNSFLFHVLYTVQFISVSCSLCCFPFRRAADDDLQMTVQVTRGPFLMRVGRYQWHSTLIGGERCKKSIQIGGDNRGPPRRKWDWWIIRWIEPLENITGKHLIDVSERLGKRLQ